MENNIFKIRMEEQQNPVQDEVMALVAIVRPILEGLLYALKRNVVGDVGGYDKVKLMMLARLYRSGDGDIGICFEYAVHDAIRRREPAITEKIDDALKKHCKINGGDVSSILFGAEKMGPFAFLIQPRSFSPTSLFCWQA